MPINFFKLETDWLSRVWILRFLTQSLLLYRNIPRRARMPRHTKTHDEAHMQYTEGTVRSAVHPPKHGPTSRKT